MEGTSNRYYSFISFSNEPFDTSNVDETSIYKGFFKLNGHLGKKNTKQLLKTLLDSVSYEGDAIGSFEPEIVCTFWDKNGHRRGETAFCGDWAFTNPSILPLTKSSHLSEKAKKRIKLLMEGPSSEE